MRLRDAAMLLVLTGLLTLPVACFLIGKPFPPEGVDHLELTVTVEVEIVGIGKDTVALDGTLALHRGGPAGEDGRMMKGVLVGASFRGESEVFGEVRVVQSPTDVSTCAYTYSGRGEYQGGFDIQTWFWFPEHNLMLFTTSAVRVTGKAKVIPPVGQVWDAAHDEIPLRVFGPDGKDVGIVSNARGVIHGVVTLVEPGSTQSGR